MYGPLQGRRLLVGAHLERRILFGQTPETHAEFFLVGFGSRLDGHGNDRLRESRRLKHYVVVIPCESVTGGDILDADHSGDVTRVTGVDVLVLVRLNLD